MNPETGRILAVDLGQQRIGVALSDPTGSIAQPLETLAASGGKRDLTRVASLAKEHEVSAVVVGLPLLLSGADGEGAEQARSFAAQLQRRLPRGVKIHLWDERLTSTEAERAMIADDTRRDRRRERVDTIAAMLILQSFLDANSGSTAGSAAGCDS